jgi:glycosyltransferase involved in cell wall biosynthesis
MDVPVAPRQHHSTCIRGAQSLFTVVQLGARMSYAVPCTLSTVGALERLYTDISASSGWPATVSRMTSVVSKLGSLKRLSGRKVPGLPASSVRQFPFFGLEYRRRLLRAKNATMRTAAWLWAGSWICSKAIRDGLGKSTSAFCYNTAGLELLQYCRDTSRRGILEQTIAPRIIEEQFFRDETAAWPGWERIQGSDDLLEEHAKRESEEWSSADLIVCASEFVRDGISRVARSCPNVRVVPYGVRIGPALKRNRREGKLHVLFCGAVGLRKGVPYLARSAEKLGNRNFHFRFVGQIGCSPPALKQLLRVADLAGPVPRSDVHHHYAWADVFVLPTLCEGSATVCYEALAAGLPVITTANSGSVVRHGIDGFIVPIRDPDAIAETLDRLAADTILLESMSRNARSRAEEFTIEKYGERLLEALGVQAATSVLSLQQ